MINFKIHLQISLHLSVSPVNRTNGISSIEFRNYLMLQNFLNFFSNKILNRLHLFILTSLSFNPMLLRLNTSGFELTCVQSKHTCNCNHRGKFLALLYFDLALEKTILRHEERHRFDYGLQPFSFVSTFRHLYNKN